MLRLSLRRPISAAPLWIVLVASAAGGLFLTHASSAVAQEAEDPATAKARERFGEGRAAYDKGDFATAIARWEEAFAIKPNNKLLIYIARSWFQLGKLDKALGSMERYASIGAEEEAYVHEELKQMRQEGQKQSLRKAQQEVDAAMTVATPGAKPSRPVVEERLEIDRRFVEVPFNVTTEPPGAEVYVDSKEWGSQGTTPLNIKLFSGRHTLYIERAHYAPQQVEITARPVQEGTTAQRVKVVLERQQVQVELTTTPDTAEITLIKDDGESLKLGRGRYVGRMPAGEAKFVLDAVGLGQREFTRTIEVGESAEAVQRIDLDMRNASAIRRDELNKLGTLQVEGYLIGADIRVDGRLIGQTPRQSVELTPGPHTLEISKEGFAPLTQVIRIEDGEVLRFETPETLQVLDSGVNWGGWLTLTAGLATAGAGGYFTYAGLQRQQEADDVPRPFENDTSADANARRQSIIDLEDEASQQHLISYILYGAGGAAVVTGIVLLAVGGDDDVKVVTRDGEEYHIAVTPVVAGSPGVGLTITLP